MLTCCDVGEEWFFIKSIYNMLFGYSPISTINFLINVPRDKLNSLKLKLWLSLKSYADSLVQQNNTILINWSMLLQFYNNTKLSQILKQKLIGICQGSLKTLC